MELSVPLRVAIYPYIPDLAGDSFKSLTDFITEEYKKISPGVDIDITCDWDPYNLDKMNSTYLKLDGFDVLEVDTIILGEFVENLLALDGIFPVNGDIFLPSAVDSVKIKETLYGVPTLQCASFLTELKAQESPPILEDWTSYNKMDHVMKGAGVRLFGDFCGSYTLPLFYLDAYIDKYGPVNLQNGIESNPADDPKLMANMSSFMSYGTADNGSNPTTDGTYHRDSKQMINDIADSDHAFVYGYSELLAQVQKASASKDKRKSILNSVSAPLDQANYLLTYTDAVVVNSSRYNGGSPQRADAIKDFVTFYTDLKLRTQYALGEDLPKEDVCPRYVLPACKDFYSEEIVVSYPYYGMLRKALERSTPAPNHDFYGQKDRLNTELKQVLEMN